MAAPARESQLCSTSAVKEVHFGRKPQFFSTSVVKEVHFGSSGLKVATVQHKCSKEIHSAARFLTQGSPRTQKPLLVGLSLFFCHPFRFACLWYVLLHMLVCHVQPFTYWSSNGFARRSYIDFHPRGISFLAVADQASPALFVFGGSVFGRVFVLGLQPYLVVLRACPR